MHMVEEQIVRRGISDPRVIAAFGGVPRHRFVPEHERSRSYEDTPLPIGHNQTISQPYIVAYMLQALDLHGDEKVLEIGTGSGYQAALISKLAGEVYTIERHEVLADSANKILVELGYDNVYVIHSDGSEGWPEHAPYDAIIVAAGAPVIPQPLLEQLAEGGRLVIPVGEAGRQILQLWTRSSDGFSFDELVPVAFVPLIGKAGWKE
jgi:protein-L-isoaspartate(D-aspartate) O-methyltransferase